MTKFASQAERLRDYRRRNKEAANSANLQASGTRAEMEKFLAGLPKANSLRSYLHEGNFAEFKRKIEHYNNEIAPREYWAKALTLVHELRQKANWRVLTLDEVLASDGYKALHFPMEREFVQLIVEQQIPESEVSEADRASGNGNALYRFDWNDAKTEGHERQ
jgi:hypothetical protein